jgi:hypothetical protein
LQQKLHPEFLLLFLLKNVSQQKKTEHGSGGGDEERFSMSSLCARKAFVFLNRNEM